MISNLSVIHKDTLASIKAGALTPQCIEGDLLNALKDLRTCLKDNASLNPESKETVIQSCKVVNKTFTDEDFLGWIQLKSQDLFTWNDYSQAWHKMTTAKDLVVQITKTADGEETVLNDDSGLLSTWAVCSRICMAYFYFNEINKEESEQQFFEHPPYDYTRPHNWQKEPDFPSMGEAIAAILNLAAGKGQPQVLKQTLENFAKVHTPFFPSRLLQLVDLKIPYDYYSKCWDESHDPFSIKPWSIEICAYYVQQNGLDVKAIYEEKAPADYSTTSFNFYFCPSFKFFDTFDLIRFLSTWKTFLNHFEAAHHFHGMRLKEFLEHCTYFSFSEYPGQPEEVGLPTTRFFWHGITQNADNQHLTYRQKLNQTLSFLGDIVNGISLSLVLDSQIMKCKSQITGWDELSEDQNDVLRPVVEKYNKIKDWLEEEQQKEDHSNILKPGWEECNAEKLLCMVSFQPRSAEMSSLEKHLTGSAKEPKISFVYQSTLNTLSANLEHADLSFTTKEFAKNAHFAVSGLAAIIPDENVYIRYQKLLGKPIRVTPPQNEGLAKILNEIKATD